MSRAGEDKHRVMLAMQNEMNCQVDQDWLAHEREWYRAIWIECAELMDHYGGWKWWKHSNPDYQQVLLEIVDIWHFGLSLRLQEGAPVAQIAATLADEWERAGGGGDFHAHVERLATAALAEQHFAVDAIHDLLGCCGFDFDDLYRGYVGKNVLNSFRQDHGYKTGDYTKTWNGREDNEVLADLVQRANVDDPGFRGALYAALKERYTALG